MKEVAMVRIAQPLVAMFTLATAVLLSMSGGCSGNKDGGGGLTEDDASLGSDSPGFNPDDGSSGGNGSSSGFGGSSGFSAGDGAVANNCPAGSPLSCYVSMCGGGKHTTITGKVYDPAGKVPLYNVVVFVPNDPSKLPAITPGTNTCNSCNTPVGDYVAVALTDKTGSFTLTDVPTGSNVPLVVQIGKWRRTIQVASVADCATTTLPTSGTGQARLPRSRKEGDMPQMALLTGGEDDLGCFLTRMGIDASEYSAPGAGGRLDIYRGLGIAGVPAPTLSSGTAGDCTTTSCPLWASKKSFESYDIVLLACEGSTYDADDTLGGISFGGAGSNVTAVGKTALHDWLNEGGKVFATHFQYTWFGNGPADFKSVATWLGGSIGLGGTCTGCTIDTSFPKGQTFHDWLSAAGALNGAGINLTNVAASVSTVNTQTTSRWIYDGTKSPIQTKYMSFETPIGGIKTDAGEAAGAQYCGKAVFTDLHAGGQPLGDIPSACMATDLSPQEKALEFLFFDLAACVTNDSLPPPIPPQPPK
jgi:hypothetical protein